MRETFRNFKEIANLNGADLNVEMVRNYKDTQDMTVLAKVYVKYYAHLTNVSAKFFNITEADKASCIVEEIHKALMNFDSEKGAAIQTLVTKYVNNRLRAETQSESYQVRKANSESDSYEGLCEVSGIAEETEEDASIAETLSVLDSLEITENERRYCEIILLDRTGELADKDKDREVISTTKILDTEIAQIMGITGAGVAYIRKSLAKKLTPEMIMGL